ncbi:MAG: caspase family protein [Capsulimonadaceae bacterium]|nr:caspase family protein [Capsulimonadaceae bacterium]
MRYAPISASVGKSLFLAVVSVAVFSAFACVSQIANAQLVEKRIVLTPIADAPSFAKYALVIGVTDYSVPMRLHVCGNDASHFASMIRSRFGFDNVVLMSDLPGTDPGLRPTERNIKSALETMYDGIVPGKSEVIVYFSGHGMRAKDSAGIDTDWLLPEDFDRRDIAGSCINFSTIRERLDTLQPKRVFLVTDACRELMGKGILTGGFGESLREGHLGPEVAELHSCLPTETSLEGNPADFNESVFTHYLIRALSGDRDAAIQDENVITFDSLKEYVQFNVHSYAAKLNAVQTPDGRATYGSMVLARLLPGDADRQIIASEPVPAPASATPALPPGFLPVTQIADNQPTTVTSTPSSEPTAEPPSIPAGFVSVAQLANSEPAALNQIGSNSTEVIPANPPEFVSVTSGEKYVGIPATTSIVTNSTSGSSNASTSSTTYFWQRPSASPGRYMCPPLYPGMIRPRPPQPWRPRFRRIVIFQGRPVPCRVQIDRAVGR